MQHAALFAKVAAYLAEMAKRHPEVPRPKLVGPNGLSAIDASEKYLPPLLRKAGDQLDIVGTHDYDRRGDRWKALTKAAKGRPVWGTEWCVNGPDDSPGLIRSATEFWLAMSEAFNGGANVWMAYDWVYPPRQGGEALIHLKWGESWEADPDLPWVPAIRLPSGTRHDGGLQQRIRPGRQRLFQTRGESLRLPQQGGETRRPECRQCAGPASGAGGEFPRSGRPVRPRRG